MKVLSITCMRNEGPHCLEWIAHHLAAGIDHFLIYTNDCDDGTDDILDLLDDAQIVTHERLGPIGKSSVQWQALKHASTHQTYNDADWVLISDCDEFVNLREPLNSVHQLIAALPQNTDALAMRWRLFGNSGCIEMQDILSTELFCQAAPEDIALPLAHFFKSLFRPSAFRQIGVHRPKRRNDHTPVWVDGSGQLLPQKFGEMDQRINLFGMPTASALVQLNHYSLRSAENFIVKRARGLPNHMDREVGLGYWVERNFNTVHDSSIARMVPATRAKLSELLQIRGLEKLHQKTCAAHKSTFQNLMTRREEIQLFWQICLSAASQPPPAALAKAQIRRIANADRPAP